MSDELDLSFDDEVTQTRECPACGEDMELRRNRETQEQFWGCSNYPTCKKTLPIHVPGNKIPWGAWETDDVSDFEMEEYRDLRDAYGLMEDGDLRSIFDPND